MKRYAEDGQRLTDCCGCYSTFDEHGVLYCKKCYEEVPMGQGDGLEYRGQDAPVAEKVKTGEFDLEDGRTVEVFTWTRSN